MKVEFKRDLNHNYMILHSDTDVDTGAYQVRMLAANSISCLLPSRLQRIDGKPLFYYDITSKQSLATLYEKQQLGIEELEFFFLSIVHGIEEMAAFLLNQDQLVLEPEFLFLDVEKKAMYFVCLPGYKKEIWKQFRDFTEYLLPKINHQDIRAVNVGYQIYRKVMEEDFQMEQLVQMLYRSNSGEASGKEIGQEIERISESKEKIFEENKEDKESAEDGCSEKETEEKVVPKRKSFSYYQKGALITMTFGAILLTSAAMARRLGYLSELSSLVLIGAMLVLGFLGIFAGFAWKWLEKKKKEPVLPGLREKKEKILLKEEEKELLEEIFFGDLETSSEKKQSKDYIGETEELSCNMSERSAILLGKDPEGLDTIILKEELIVIGKLPVASDVVIDLPTVSRIHAKIRRKGEEYYVLDLNSRNGTYVNGRILKGEEEYCLKNQDEIEFGEAKYIFAK